MDVQTVTVVGAGTMGSGIAQACAQAGYRTHLCDALPAGLQKGVDRILAYWDAGIAKGKTTPAQKQSWAANLVSGTPMQQAVAASDLVIEAVPESIDLKQRVFHDLDAWAPPHAVLATNTSSLSIATIAAATRRPAAVVGMHFFNPVPVMKLLELVRHDATADATLATARAVGERLGKTCITARDVPGFATSRLGIVLGNEAMRMLEEGVASASDIDTAMKLGYGHPMGPLELSDLVGLDVRLAISDHLHREFGGSQYASPDVVRRLVGRGDVGKKSGKGLYDWSTGKPVERDLR